MQVNYCGIPIFRILDFSNLLIFLTVARFLGFVSVKHCNLTLDFRTLDFSKLPIFLPSSCLPWKKFIRNLPSISRARTKFLNYYSVAFIWMVTGLRLKGRTTFYYTVNSTKESTAQYLSFEWPLIRPGFPVGAVYNVYTVVLTFGSSVKS